jgi:ribosome-associated toxin RatA of RatAB toxin-antitoxin module
MESSIAIDVAAPPSLVFAIAHDVRRWPDLLPHYVAVDRSGRAENGVVTTRMIARRPLVAVLGIDLPVAWRAVCWNEPDQCRLRFRHVGGATGGMDVTWRIEPSPGGCRVTIEHRFSPRFAPWAWLVNRFFIRPIAARTLATFKAIAEAVTSTAPEATAARQESAATEPAYPVR